jgi:hypothetical protein
MATGARVKMRRQGDRNPARRGAKAIRDESSQRRDEP